MTHNKLTKNFNFLEKIEPFSVNIPALINEIEQIEKFKDVETSIHKISKALELTLDIFCEWKFGLESNEYKYFSKLKLHELIQELKAKGFVDDVRLLNNMHTIKLDRNVVSHKDKSNLKQKYESRDGLNNLKKLYIIIINLFSEIEDVPQEDDFNFDIYECSIPIPKSDLISAIKEEDRKSEFKKNDSITSEIKIDHDNLMNWLTIKNVKIIIPIYQRNYKWDTNNIGILFDDILERKKDNTSHYFGTIAQKTICTKNNQIQIKIIDGQQRLTTALLFMAAVRDVLKNKFKRDWNNFEYLKPFFERKLDEYIWNPGGNHKDNDIFKGILKGKIENMNSTSNFLINYNTLSGKISEHCNEPNDILLLTNVFLEKFQVATINFDSDIYTNKKEMEIFENLNSKGVELSVNDLIKNHIYNFCSEELINNPKYELEIPGIFINGLLGNSKLNEDDRLLEKFYLSIAEMVVGDEIEKMRNERFKKIKSSINEFFESNNESLGFDSNKRVDNIEDYKKMISFLSKFMQTYSEIIGQIDTTKFTKPTDCKNYIDLISNKDKRIMFVYFSYILVLFTEYNKKQVWKFEYGDPIFKFEKNEINHIKNLYFEIAKYIIRTQIISGQGDSNIKRKIIAIAHFIYKNYKNFTSIDKLCDKAIQEIKKLYDENGEYSIGKFKSQLSGDLNNIGATGILFLLEGHMCGTFAGDGECIKREKSTLEHIMPKEKKEWIDAIKKAKDNPDDHGNYVNKLGNFLLLSKTKNSKSSNKDFLYTQQHVYNNLTSPLYKNANDNIDVFKKETWTYNDIDKRTHELISYVLKNIITE